MNRADQLVDQAADRLQKFADEAAADGGFKAMLAEPLADDAEFLRRLKPSLIKARLKGSAPTDLPPRHGFVQASPQAKRDGGPSPFLVLGVAFAVGVVLAKVIDWRGHAHPRD
jgi:hypothetical protein